MNKSILVEIIIIWIALQLILLSWVIIRINNDVVNNIKNCSKIEKLSIPERIIISSLFPLIVFIPTPHWLIDYCENKNKI